MSDDLTGIAMAEEINVQRWNGEDGQSYNAVGCTDVEAFTAAVVKRLESDSWEYHVWGIPTAYRMSQCTSCAEGLGYNVYWHDPSDAIEDEGNECVFVRTEDIAGVEIQSCDCPDDATEEQFRAAAIARLTPPSVP